MKILSKYSVEAKLLASASSLENIKKMFYSKDVVLTSINDKEWSVANAKGVLEDFKVVLKGGRYRSENNV